MRVALLSVAALAAASCGSHHSAVRSEPAFEADIDRWSESWREGGETLDVVVQVPKQSGSYPLVVYLPGLGQTASSGARWRNAWTQAGYAVVSIQARQDGQEVWRSEAARTGNFAAIARERFSRKALEAGRRHVDFALEQLVHKPAADPRFARVDLSRIALAGYELGAQTVASLWVESRAVPAAFKAAILLGPYGDPFGGARDARLAKLDSKTLVVNGSLQEDLYGIMPRLAGTPPVGSAWHLVLLGSSESLLGGDALGEDIVIPRLGDKPVRETGPSSRGGGHAHFRADFAEDRKLAASGHEWQNAPSDSEPESAALNTSRLRQLQASAVRGVTTAFLDKMLKDEQVASEWLKHFGKSRFHDAATLRAPLS